MQMVFIPLLKLNFYLYLNSLKPSNSDELSFSKSVKKYSIIMMIRTTLFRSFSKMQHNTISFLFGNRIGNITNGNLGAIQMIDQTSGYFKNFYIIDADIFQGFSDLFSK